MWRSGFLTLLVKMAGAAVLSAGVVTLAWSSGRWPAPGSAAPWIAFAAAALAGIGLAALIAWRLVRRLRLLEGAARELTRGGFGAQVQIGAQDEFGRLGQVFNYMSQQLLAYDGETRRLYQGLEDGGQETLLALENVLESKDRYTLGHSRRVGGWAAEIGRELGLPDIEIKHLLYGGILHDVGKIGVVEPILHKRGALSEEEREAVRAHPTIGASIIGGIGFLRPMLPAVRSHHERWDGTGYPDRLAGERIPLMARIVGAADVWDACTSERTYQQAMSAERALMILRGLRGHQLDPAIVDAIERIVRRKQASGEPLDGAGTEPPGNVGGARTGSDG